MSTASTRSAIQRFVIDDVPWKSYIRVLRAFEEKRRVRITYDRGRMELMTLSFEHERWKHLLRRLLEALAEEMGKNIAGGGSLTLKRRRKKRGLEPDECYWIKHEQQMRGVQRFNPDEHPAPELVLEVEVTRSALSRLKIYAALKVEEVWRWNGESVEVHLLGDDGEYSSSETSRVFSPFRPVELVRFLEMAATNGETEMLRAFREWVRQRIACGWEDEV